MHQPSVVGTIVALVAAAALCACGRSSADKVESPTATKQADLSKQASSPARTLRVETRLAAPSSAATQWDMEAWLAAAREDPDPNVRRHALETWAQHPGESLDPVTYALVDPDETVRARAQELVEEALARR
jgi:hypothetical protein